LVTVAIISVLAIVVVVVINVPEVLRQSRDSSRLTDMKSLNSALALYLNELPNGFTGSSSTVYVSLPDKTLSGNQTSTCTSLGLPTPPAGYAYQCSSPQSFRHVNGTGWVPVNFSQLSSGAPMSLLPADPINQSSTDLYYTYAANGPDYVVAALPESQKYASLAAQDGGNDSALFEAGSGISYLPDLGRGLVGYWPLDEGVGTTTYDASGSGHNGTFGSTAPTWTTGKIGAYALVFDGSSTSVLNNTGGFLPTGSSARTISFWAYPLSSGNYPAAFAYGCATEGNGCGDAGTGKYVSVEVSTGWGFRVDAETCGIPGPAVPSPQQAWHFFTVVFNGNNTLTFYIDGVGGSPVTPSCTINTAAGGGFSMGTGRWGYFNGTLDDVRVYDRALSAAEIVTLYNAGK
jgi:concanavalin A-like lectin/glucanase superfamily protein